MTSTQQEKPIQEFEFTIKLQVTGDYLQKHDVKSIIKVLSDSSLYNRYHWEPCLKGEKNKNNVQCAICLNDIKEKQIVYRTNCNHFYHKKCITQWFAKQGFTPNCPLCRKEQNTAYKHENIYRVHTSYSINSQNQFELERTIQREGSTYIRFHDI